MWFHLKLGLLPSLDNAFGFLGSGWVGVHLPAWVNGLKGRGGERIAESASETGGAQGSGDLGCRAGQINGPRQFLVLATDRRGKFIASTLGKVVRDPNRTIPICYFI